MDPRISWPWRKKAPGKADSSVSSISSPALSSCSATLPSHAYEDNQASKCWTHPRSIPDTHKYQEKMEVSMDQKPTIDFKCQQALEAEEKKVQILTQKLNASLEALLSKEAMVKQHAKVAEEAVAGWEAVQVQVSGLKKELEVSLQQRASAERRVSHLEEALKECVKQMRCAQEQQQQRMEQAMDSKSLEWNKLKAELEGAVSEMDQRLMEAQAQNTAMAKSLQERARAILECQEAKARVETESSLQQVKLEALEKEIGGLKYELYMQSKELEILNKEKEESSKAAEGAYKQNLEYVRKIGKLEADCDRLRTLVRKRLPGPADFAQMKMELDASLRRDSHSKRRRSAGLLHSNVASSPTSPLESHRYVIRADVNNHLKDMELMESKLLFLEEESRMLKEILARRDTEVQSPKQKAENNSSVADPSHTSITEDVVMDRFLLQSKCVVTGSSSERLDDDDDELSCSGSWASALISELDHFKNNMSLEKPSGQDRPKAQSRLQLKFSEKDQTMLKTLSNKDSELQSANLMCKDAITKLSSAFEMLGKSDMDPNVTAVMTEAHVIMLRLDGILDEMRIAVASIGDTSDEDCGNSSPGATVVSGRLEEISRPATNASSLTPDSLIRNAEHVATTEVSSGEIAHVNETEDQHPNHKDFGEIVDVNEGDERTPLYEQKIENVDIDIKENVEVDPDENEMGANEEIEIQQQLVIRHDNKVSEILQHLCNTQEELKVANMESADAKVVIRDLEKRMLGILREQESVLAGEEAKMREMQGKAESQMKILESKVASLTAELENREKEHEEMIAKCTTLEAKIEEYVKEADRKSAWILEVQEAHANKEKEIAAAKENLEDCQTTILILGKQLSALTDASESFNSSIQNCNHESFNQNTLIPKNPYFGECDQVTPRSKNSTHKRSESFTSSVSMNCNHEGVNPNALITKNSYHGDNDQTTPRSKNSTHGSFNQSTAASKSSRFNINTSSMNCRYGGVSHKNTSSMHYNHDGFNCNTPSMNCNHAGYTQNTPSTKCNNVGYNQNMTSMNCNHEGLDQKTGVSFGRSSRTHHHSRNYAHSGSVDLSSSQRTDSMRIGHGNHRRLYSEAEVKYAMESSGIRKANKKYSVAEHLRMDDDCSENSYNSYSTGSSPSISPSQEAVGVRRNPNVNLSVRTSLRRSMATAAAPTPPSSSSSSSATVTTPRGMTSNNSHTTSGFSRFFNRTKK